MSQDFPCILEQYKRRKIYFISLSTPFNLFKTCKMFNLILNRLESSLEFIPLGNSFEECIKYNEKFSKLLGINIFDPTFGTWNYGLKLRIFIFIFTLGISTSSGFLSAFDTYKDILEEQLSSLVAAFFAVMVFSFCLFIDSLKIS